MDTSNPDSAILKEILDKDSSVSLDNSQQLLAKLEPEFIDPLLKQVPSVSRSFVILVLNHFKTKQ